MKILFLVFTILPLICYSQEQDLGPLKKANKIIIRNDYSSRQNFFLLQSALIKKGYTVIINKRDFTLQTQDSLIESGSVIYRLKGHVEDKSVSLSGTYKTSVVTSVFGEKQEVFNYDIANTGLNGTLPQKMFALLQNLAKEINGELTYVKEKKKKRGTIF